MKQKKKTPKTKMKEAKVELYIILDHYVIYVWSEKDLVISKHMSYKLTVIKKKKTPIKTQVEKQAIFGSINATHSSSYL